ncbi:MAG: cbb3-type cytochrome oxidase assembly protein CcoS [Proteobacteria bacterium]|nr:MAG: cbb3-type cytochrome oxidase assembly protein CcoS [Pseudomonadota bacterium]
MEIVYVLLPLSLLLAGFFVLAYWWSARSGQFDDLNTPAVRILPEETERGEH